MGRAIEMAVYMLQPIAVEKGTVFFAQIPQPGWLVWWNNKRCRVIREHDREVFGLGEETVMKLSLIVEYLT